MENVSGSSWTAVQTAVAIGSVQTAVAAATTKARTPCGTQLRRQLRKHQIGWVPSTADKRLMQWMDPQESGALTNASGASEEQRKENKKAMEERRDMLVAAIEEHDNYMIAMLSLDSSKRGVKVCIPTPMVMEDRSCGKTIEQDKRYVRKRVQSLNKEIKS